ncbi:MAG: stage III sporulation protein SpoIIIAB [Clostridia bacterium]
MREKKNEGIELLLKIIGGLLIISASGLLGIIFSNRLSQRYRELKNLRRYMQMLETEVTYGATPLPVALSNISKKADGMLVSFFNCISDSLINRSFYTVRDAWTYGTEAVLMQSSLKSADIELIKSFGSILGCSDREDQKKHFELFYLQLMHQEDAAKEEIRKSAKMYRSLGFLLGIAVFVILV